MSVKQKQKFTKSKKLPVQWSSKIPTRCKRNGITSELHRVKGIANDFHFEA